LAISAATSIEKIRPSSELAPLRISVSGADLDGRSALAKRLTDTCEIVVDGTGTPSAGPDDAAKDAAQADLTVVVVEAPAGLTAEAKQIAASACMAGVRHLVVAVDKLDAVGWDREAFEGVAESFRKFVAHFDPTSVAAIPVSVLAGDNVETRSTHTPWYDGPTLVAYLGALDVDPDIGTRPFRLPIAAVIRPDPDHRHYEGTLTCGTLRRGDAVQVAVSGTASTVERVLVDGNEVELASAGDAVTVRLSSHVDLASGDMLVPPEHRPQPTAQFAAHVAWISDGPLLPGRDYTLSIAGREVTASVTAMKYRIDLETLRHDAARTLRRGEIGACTIALAEPLAIDDFADFPQTGRFTLRERHTGETIASGTVDFALRRGVNVHEQALTVSKSVRTALKSQSACILWFTGLSGAGKSTIANIVEGRLAARGQHTYMLDGDNVRYGLNKDLGFTAADRVENIRRVGEVSKLFVDSGLIVLCSFISPFRAERDGVRGLVEPGEFIEIYIKAPLDVCESRDPKGLYAKSRAGRLPNFTGIDSPYEVPEAPDLVLDTTSGPAEALADQVIGLLLSRGIVAQTPPAKG
jgi:bifunctional enzyme CysN/CysC